MQPQTHTRSGQEAIIGGKKALQKYPVLNLFTNLNWVIEALHECEKYPEGPQSAQAFSRVLGHLAPPHILEVFVQACLMKM